MKLIGIALLSVGFSGAVMAAAPVAAPEVSPASAAGALALLGGALLVIRGRRKRQ
jgi:LPXTG-motif cell wall-anchored protein